MPSFPSDIRAQPPARPAVSDADLLAASVRLRVEDPQGHSCGSGTIIDALPGGEALVLTCGHLFRDSQGKGKIEVDVFGPAPAAHVTGRVLAFDLERDVAFVAFRPLAAVTVARVAPRGYAIRPGDAVASVGCDHGEDPTVQHSQINNLDRFLDPVEQRLGHKIEEPHAPWNLEVAGQPVDGPQRRRTLFQRRHGDRQFATPPSRRSDNEGVFAGLGSIHAALDEQRMAFVYQRPAAPPTLVAATNIPAARSRTKDKRLPRPIPSRRRAARLRRSAFPMNSSRASAPPRCGRRRGRHPCRVRRSPDKRP